jgi:ABC-2 type transport system permease protein
MGQSIRCYGKTAAMAAAGIVGDSPLFVVDYILRFMRVALLLAIWRTLFRGRPETAGLPLAAVLTYTLISEVFSEPLGGYTGLTDAFWDGSIATRFLRPMSLFGQFAAEAAGTWVFNFALFSLPLLCLAPLFGVRPLPASPAAAGLFMVSLTLGISVGMALDYISGAISVGLEITPGILERARRAVGGLLSGAIIPFALMPWGLGKALVWTPFAALASAPLQIYIGRGDPARLLASQALWALLLWPLAHRLWAASRERIVSYGG